MIKQEIPANTGIYFELFNTNSTSFILPDNTTINFSLGMPYNSLEIYKMGNFPYLGLKEGAEILFKDESIENIIKYISQAKRKGDVLILSKSSTSEKVKKAADEKLKFFIT